MMRHSGGVMGGAGGDSGKEEGSEGGVLGALGAVKSYLGSWVGMPSVEEHPAEGAHLTVQCSCCLPGSKQACLP